MADTVARRRLRTAVRGLESAVRAINLSVVLLPQENAEQALTAALRDAEARLQEVRERNQERIYADGGQELQDRVLGETDSAGNRLFLTEGEPLRRPTPRPEVTE